MSKVRVKRAVRGDPAELYFREDHMTIYEGTYVSNQTIKVPMSGDGRLLWQHRMRLLHRGKGTTMEEENSRFWWELSDYGDYPDPESGEMPTGDLYFESF